MKYLSKKSSHHKSVVERFKITRGVVHQGNLESIVQRPELRINGKHVYADVFSKAASLLEGIIRLHPFADGNKRTALLATIYYLRLEGYGIAVPLSAVRYTVKIAKNDKNDERNTKKLIREIADWLSNHSAKSKRQLLGRIAIHITLPYLFLIFLAKIGFKKYVFKRFLTGWLLTFTQNTLKKHPILRSLLMRP